ncbi:MAG: TolC family protein [bacterium]|nr:TolC family protein [bacterium]
MKMICVFLFLVTAITALPAVAADGVRMDTAVEKGIRMDAQFKNRLLDDQKARLEVETARKTKWFNVDLEGSYLFKSQQLEIAFPQPLPVPGSTLTAGSKHNYDLKLSVMHPIYSGDIISNSISLEEQKEAAEKYNIQLRRIEVATQIKGVYFNYRLLESKKRSLTLLLKNLELHYKRLNDLYKEDLAKRSDLLETEMKITEAGFNMEGLNRRMEEESIRFTRLCSYDIGEIERNYRESTGSPEESLARFTAFHPALKSIGHNIRMMETGKKIVSGKYRPQVRGFAELHWGKPGIDFFRNEWSLYFQGGINVALRVFDWNRKKRDLGLADFSIRQLKNREEEIITEAKRGLNQLYAGLRSLDRQLEMAAKLAAAAEEDAKLKEELYRENQAANVDYLSALLDKERYESMKEELKFQAQLIKLNINGLIGKEVEK